MTAAGTRGSDRMARASLSGAIGMVAYTYAGYPALLWVLSRLRPRQAAEPAAVEPHVSLVIAAYDEEAVIERRLANIAELDYPADRLEVIVATDGSSDGTAEIARRAGAKVLNRPVTVLHRPERAGKAAALNRAVAAASGEVVVFSDANNVYRPETLRALLAPFADPSVGVATGRKTITDALARDLDGAEGLYWRYESAIKSWETHLGSVTGVAGEVLAIRREAYRPLPRGTVNDDFVLAFQAALDGWDIAYAPDAVSLEPASASLDDEATRRSRIVSGRYQALLRLFPRLARRRPLLAWQVASHKGLRPLVPIAMVVAAVSNAWLVRGSRPARVLAGLQVAFYAAAGAGARLERAGRRVPQVLYLPWYLCRVNAAALAGMWRAATGADSAGWTRVRRGDETSPS